MRGCWRFAKWIPLVVVVVGWVACPAWGEEQRYLTGHAEPVYKVAYSADGRFLVSASFDKTVRAWDRASGQTLVMWEDHEQLVLALGLSRDGKQVASGGLDRRVYVYDMPAVVPQGTYALSAAASATAASGDGALLAVGREDGTVGLLRSASGEVVRQWEGMPGGVTSVAWQADGARVWAAFEGGEVKSWNTADGTAGIALRMGGVPRGMAVLPDGQRLAVAGDDGELGVYHAVPPETLVVGNVGEMTALEVAADGSWFAVGTEDGRVRVYQTADFTELRSVECGAAVRGLTLRGDGGELAVACTSGEVQLRNPADLAEVARWQTGGVALEQVAYHPTSERLATTGSDGAVRVWRLPIVAPSAVPLAGDASEALAISSDGSLLATVDGQGVMRVVDMGDGSERRTISTTGARALSAAFTPDGSKLLAAGDDGRIRIHDVKSGGTLSIEGPAVRNETLVIDSAGQRVLAGGADGVVRVWNVVDGALEGELAHEGASVMGVAVTEDDVTVVTVAGTTVRAWKLADRAATWSVELPSEGRLIAVAPGGDELVVGGDDGQLHWYGLADGAMRGEQKGHEGPIAGMSWGANGRMLATVGDDLRVKVWDVAVREVVGEWTVATAVTQLKLGSDGASVVGIAADGQRWVWPIAWERTVGRLPSAGEWLAYTPDGRGIVAAGGDAVVRSWPMEEEAEPRTFDLGAGKATGMALRLDGSQLAAANETGLVRVWNLADGALATEWSVDGGVTSLRFAGDGRYLAVGGADGTLRLCDANSGSELRRIETQQGVIKQARLAKAEDWLTRGADQSVRLHRASRLLSVIAHQGAARHVACDGEGKWLFTAGDDGSVVQWNAADLDLLRRFEGLAGRVTCLAVGGEVLAAGDEKGKMRAWHLSNGRLLSEWEASSAAIDAELSKDGKLLWTVGSLVLEVYRVADGRRMFTSQKLPGELRTVAMAGDGGSLVTTTADAGVQQWTELYAGAKYELAGHEAHVYAVAFNGDGTQLASAGGDQKIKFWNLADGKHQFDGAGHAAAVYGLAYHPTEPRLASCGADKSLRYWNPVDGQQAGEVIDASPAGLYSIAYSSDGSELLAAGSAGTWQVRPMAGEGETRIYAGHEDTIYRAVYNPAGTRVATIGHAGTLRVWDAANGEPLHSEQLPVRSAYDVAYSPDGEELAVATVDRRIVLLNVPEGAR